MQVNASPAGSTILNLPITPEQHAMHQQAAFVPPQSFTRSEWCCGWLLSLLVLSVAMLLSVQAMANPEPASPHLVAADSHSQASPTSSDPHCEHDHSGQQDVEIMQRAERLDVVDCLTHRPDPAVTPLLVVTIIGLPNAAPTLAHPPLYLLTQRLRP
ncbi:hypothetical protein HNO52_06380 [Billgrantia diversa]|uniref:hypothetical protein n=1 Tax=Halomonas sp. MCCC 1A13316 TaxID=2733487 RepID=UPI0018A3E493|nr:hypothetical protein [Halomonas sp. MCCC 1A13316]QOR38177.1 hypothetical protein HNO52_06380 [Halomonas sp. MCCC 1A13316]